jgi:CheY-like chemotaxis protein
LTARSRKQDRDQCLAAGMDDFLAKPVHAADLWAAIERVLGSGSQESGVRNRGSGLRTQESGVGAQELEERNSLLDPAVILAACGGDPVILERICQAFRTQLPDQLTAVEDALRTRDCARLRETAHKLSGIISAFSTAAGRVASDLEDSAAQDRFDEAPALIRRLQSMTQELFQTLDGISIESLRQHQAKIESAKQSS